MDSVQPLRISKNPPTATPNGKMAVSRPLSEIGSTERRRNSPSYNQATRKMIVSREASPYPEHSGIQDSTRAFWSKDAMSPSRFDNENSPDRSPSPSLLSPKRRASIEKLKQASRVKQSNIFTLQSKEAYDPSTMPMVERPSANRPLSQQLANNSFTRYDSLRKENSPIRSPQRMGHKRTETEIHVPTLTNTPSRVPLPASPSKDASPSPTKSSLSRASQFGTAFDHEQAAWSEEEGASTPRTLHRHHKSVTFHEEPPVINEYEEQTPEPSVTMGGSREGSWESDEYSDADYSFERGSSAGPHHDDSFDEDLENADKTPVVLPEDWSRMSPDAARTDLVDADDDVFESSVESPGAARARFGRSESVASDGSTRPLPPLPAFMKELRNSSNSSDNADRTSQAQRGLPSPPKRASCSKDDILQMTRRSSLSHQDRLQLLDEHNARPGSKQSHKSEEEHGVPEELTITNLDTGEKVDLSVNVAETEVEDDSFVADLDDFARSPPKISRESILRKVRNSRYDFEEEEDVDASEIEGDASPAPPNYEQLARMHPDDPIPSRENSRETSGIYRAFLVEQNAAVESVSIKQEPLDDDDAVDMAAIPSAEEQQSTSRRSPSHMDDFGRQSSVIHHGIHSPSDDEDASGSRYSSLGPEAESTVLYAQREASADAHEGKESLQDAMQLLSVQDYSAPKQKETGGGSFMGLPAYLSSDDYGFGMEQYITPTPPQSSESTKHDIMASAPVLQPAAELKPALKKDLPRPTYDGSEFSPPVSPVSPPGTPGSVIHHSDSEVSAPDEHNGISEEPVARSSPEIPERRATIRTGGKLKARPSATPADFQMMAQQRRVVSAEHPVPAIPQAYQAEFGETTEVSGETESEYSPEADGSKADSGVGQSPDVVLAGEGKKMKLDLDIPAFGSTVAGDGLNLDKEFDRVIESQKVGSPFPLPSYARFEPANQQGQYTFPTPGPSCGSGTAENLSHAPTPYSPHQTSSSGTNSYPRTQKGYLMRQNTKVVVASNRDFSNDSSGTAKSSESAANGQARAGAPRAMRSGGSSPRKPSAEQVLKTEPWNGKARRKSQRNISAQQGHRSEPAPPLPGQPSALGVVDEDFAAGTSSLEDEVAEGVERGRLFVKVVGVKDLDLPLPRNERLAFQLTLDNGLHCVTTADLALGTSAPIGQEFELVVLNDLEFQLTLTTRLPAPPKAAIPPPPSPTKSLLRSPHKPTGLARFLTSPRKRAERERAERAAAAAADAAAQRVHDEAARQRASIQPTAWDLLHELVNADDGAFARAYVNLQAHERLCFGRALTVDVPCYNEWALEKDAAVVSSVRSKRGNHAAGAVRRVPYVVGQLEVQMLYVPRPRGASEEGMPKSLGGAVREMGKAGEVREVVFEGCLSQEGGDCVHWRRRFFRLQGSKLTAYHEHTHQKRAVINLAKAARLVDDKTSLVAAPASSAANSARRKSAFAEEDEGYQYVETGFRLRFANGETIDFYADSVGEKSAWMAALAQVIGKPDTGSGSGGKASAKWTDIVLARERAAPAEAAAVGKGKETTTTAVRDFSLPEPEPRKAFGTAAGSKSVPNSPIKGSRPFSQASVTTEQQQRPGTPPMGARRGHRERKAVKSMIF